jgi:hypothetical protein
MKKPCLYFAIIVSLLLLAGCKKDEQFTPVKKDSVGVYYWFTNYNSTNLTCWLRTTDNYIWTWYDKTFKMFSSDNKLTASFTKPLDELYETGYYGTTYLSGTAIGNENGNFENFCLYYNDDGPDPENYNTQLRVVEMDGNGYTSVKGTPIHYHYRYSDYLMTGRFIKTNSHYYIMYLFTCYDTSSVNNYPAFRDSLVFVKTDHNMNILSRYQVAASDTLLGESQTVYDIRESGSRVYVCRTDKPEYAYYYGNSMIEIFDKDLNLLNKVSLEDVYPGGSNWNTYHKVFQKIFVSGNRLIAFGERQESYSDKNTLLMTVFDVDGNFMNSVNIPTRKPNAFLKGVETCPDGKFLLYYSESDETSETTPCVGVCKIDANGTQDYTLLFPENDPNSYTPCMAYENSDGTITIYAVKKGQQSPEQTLVVRMDRTGKIQ